jgi:hypothetical protein
MRKKPIFYLAILALIAFSSCLTIEKKTYTFELKDNDSGTLTIKYYNIMSMKDDTTDVSEVDFEELIDSYIEGNSIEQDYEDAIIRSKRLYEEDGVLCGEVIIDFTSLRSVGLYQYDTKCPYMFNLGSFLESETFLNSNGEYGGDIMPVVFWPRTLKSLTVTTYVNSPDESTVSLLDEYRRWK